MRNVFPNRQVPHLWAHKIQDSARNANGSLYFTGDTIYSYGSHFPIARHVVNDRGQPAVLYTRDSYGITTSKHQTLVRCAIPSNVPTFTVDLKGWSTREYAPGEGWRDANVQALASKALASYVARVNDAIGKMARSRLHKEWAHRTACELREEAIAFAQFFGVSENDVPIVPELTDEVIAELRKAEALKQSAKRKETKCKEAERAAMLVRECDAWRNGSNDYRMALYSVPVMLRLSADGANVETSRGASCPIIAAKLALELVRECKTTAQSWSSPPAERVALGDFRLDKIAADGTLTAGCHTIQFDEINRFATAQGW